MKAKVFSILALLLVAATGAMAQTTYTVTVKEGTEDAEKWTATPNPAEAGQTVTATYSGSKKVKSVKAVLKAPTGTPLDNTTTAWADGSTYAVPAGGLTYSDAITVAGDVTLVLTAGETLTLNKGIGLADGATLTVQGEGTMNINGTNSSTASTVAGGTGTLVLTSGTLTAKGGDGQGFSGNAYMQQTGAAGGVAINGNVIVEGGTLTATGGNGGSVSGDGWNNRCGNGGAAISLALTINSGTVTTTNGSNGTNSTNGMQGNSAGSGGKAVAGTVTDNR